MDDAEARTILRAHGEDPPKRGRLTARWHDLAGHYAESAADPHPVAGPAADLVGDEYAEGVTESDFDPAAPDWVAEQAEEYEAAPPPPPIPLPAERRPTRPRRQSAAERFRARTQRQAKPASRKTHKRVPVDGLISSAWAAMGGLAGQIDPPLGRCLVMQAPVSGLILEDVVRGTAADRVLQPIARAEEKAEKILALLGPPAIVAALEASANLPEQQMRTRQAILLPLLERSLILWARIAGDKLDMQLQRAAEEGPARQRAAELMAMIWPQYAEQEGAEQEGAAGGAARETVSA